MLDAVLVQLSDLHFLEELRQTLSYFRSFSRKKKKKKRGTAKFFSLKKYEIVIRRRDGSCVHEKKDGKLLNFLGERQILCIREYTKRGTLP